MDYSRMNCHQRLAMLDGERYSVRDQVFEMLDELGVVEILRASTPLNRQWQIDRLARALEQIEWLDEAIHETSIECDEEDDARKRKTP